MEYQKFTKEIRREAEKLFGSEYQITVQTVLKENKCKEEALCIFDSRESEGAVPLIYLRGYYEAYCNGKTMETCAVEIWRVFHSCQEISEEAGETYREITDWEQTKEMIYPILLPREWNRELLQTLEYRNMLDLAVCYIVRENKGNVGVATARVTKELAQEWQVTEEMLYFQALENLKHDGYQLKKMCEVIQEGIEDLTGEERNMYEEEYSVSGGLEMAYVLTNREKLYGAAGILLGKEYFQKFFGEQSLYILPSSTHELILMPYNRMWSVGVLNKMVQEVNKEQVAENEKLADHIYLYDAERGVIRGL